jgi:hypothetical protein
MQPGARRVSRALRRILQLDDQRALAPATTIVLSLVIYRVVPHKVVMAGMLLATVVPPCSPELPGASFESIESELIRARTFRRDPALAVEHVGSSAANRR